MKKHDRHQLKNLFFVLKTFFEKLTLAKTPEEKITLLYKYAPICHSALNDMEQLMGFHDNETLEQLSAIKKEALGDK